MIIESFFRSIPEFKGKKRLIAFLYRQKRRNAKDIIVYGKYSCVYKLPNIIENVGFDIFANGIYENDTIDFVVDKCKDSAFFIDIGANIGSISIPVSKRLSGLKVVCVEASQTVYEYLVWNVKQNGLRDIILIDKAVSEFDDMEVDFFSPEEKYGKGSMAPVFEKKGKIVKTVTLKKIMEDCGSGEIGIIKVDVEGFECFVFKGAATILCRGDSPDILFEFVDWAEGNAGAKPGDAQQLLMEYGYRLYLIDNNNLKHEIDRPLQSGAAMIWATKKY